MLEIEIYRVSKTFYIVWYYDNDSNICDITSFSFTKSKLKVRREKSKEK